MRKKLRFGIKTIPQHTTYDDILRVWLEADKVPIFEHAWLFDHFMPLGPGGTGPCMEGWSLLAALAARTERLRLGLMVTGNSYRHPAVLANIAATVDLISKGRLDLGIGAGWHEPEHKMYAIPFYSTAERIRRLGEACEVIKRLWTEKTATFEGKYYQLKDAYCEPKPHQKPHPPLVIGGGGEKLTLRVAAKHANIWNYPGGSAEEFQRKSKILDEHCAAVGRDPLTIERSVQLVRIPAGDLKAVRDSGRGFIAAGATHIIVPVSTPCPEGFVSRLADEVVEPLFQEADKE